MDDLRYPIGQFKAVLEPTQEQRRQFINQIANIPRSVQQVISGLDEEQLNTSYRPGGWAVTQVVHHLADHGVNIYVRFKRALTEDEPAVGSYREDLWAQLSDYRDTPLEVSILLMEAIHKRFSALLSSLTPSDFQRTFSGSTHGVMTLDIALQRYAWHARHHMAQITSLRQRKGW